MAVRHYQSGEFQSLSYCKHTQILIIMLKHTKEHPTPLFCKLVCGCSFAKLYWHFIHFFLFLSGTCRLQDADDPGRAVCQCSWEAPQNDRLAWKLQGTHNIGAIRWPLCSEVRNNLGGFFLVNIVQRKHCMFSWQFVFVFVCRKQGNW